MTKQLSAYPNYPAYLKDQPYEHHGISFTVTADDAQPFKNYTVGFTHDGRDYTKTFRNVDEHYPLMVVRQKIDVVLGICPTWDEQK